MRSLFFFYFRRLLPFIGRFISRHDNAYTYLPESVLAFPGPDELALLMQASGFRAVRYERLFGGIVAIHVGVRE
jgi:demethylmenaquinone methyltransferase/2-methoxy-6-polyprenyl-1,4-benzoquinol methylase